MKTGHILHSLMGMMLPATNTTRIEKESKMPNYLCKRCNTYTAIEPGTTGEYCANQSCPAYMMAVPLSEAKAADPRSPRSADSRSLRIDNSPVFTADPRNLVDPRYRNYQQEKVELNRIANAAKQESELLFKECRELVYSPMTPKVLKEIMSYLFDSRSHETMKAALEKRFCSEGGFELHLGERNGKDATQSFWFMPVKPEPPSKIEILKVTHSDTYKTVKLVFSRELTPKEYGRIVADITHLIYVIDYEKND